MKWSSFLCNFASEILRFVTVLESIQLPIAEDLSRFNNVFQQTLKHDNPLLKVALEHLAKRKGKQMRPILTILSARLCGKVNDSVLNAAVGLELLHTASLVHDDVVDESNRRRGQQSLNALMDNKVSVLVGDYLLSRALYHVSLTENIKVFTSVSNLGQILADGELVQLHNIDSNKFDEGSYYEIISKKTASLFAACAQFGTLLGGGSDDDVERMRQFGKLIGMCFQLRDDIFDYDRTTDVGKPSGNDMREGQLTLPVIFAINKGKDPEIIAKAKAVREGSASKEDIEHLIQYTKDMGGLQYAEWAIDEFRMMADGLIKEGKDPAIAKSLHDFVAYVAQRLV